MRVWEIVDGVGWAAAQRLCYATFTGWEVEFLGKAVAMMSREARTQRRMDEARTLFHALGVNR